MQYINIMSVIIIRKLQNNDKDQVRNKPDKETLLTAQCVKQKKLTYIITIIFETQSNINKFLNRMVIWCWRMLIISFFSVSLVLPTWVDKFSSSFGRETSAKTNKKNYWKWLSYYKIKWYYLVVSGNLLFVKHFSRFQNDYNWTLQWSKSHTCCLPHILYLLSISLMICKSTGLLLNFETMLPILIAHYIAAVTVPEYTHHNKFRREIPAKIEKIRIRRKTIKNNIWNKCSYVLKLYYPALLWCSLYIFIYLYLCFLCMYYI